MKSEQTFEDQSPAHVSSHIFKHPVIVIENELATLLKSYPTKVDWTDVVDFDKFDERRSAVDCLVVNTIDVAEDYVEFIPDNDPPLREEILCWIWAIRPDLSNELISLDVSEDFRILLKSYINNVMDEFWNHMNQTP